MYDSDYIWLYNINTYHKYPKVFASVFGWSFPTPPLTSVAEIVPSGKTIGPSKPHASETYIQLIQALDKLAVKISSHAMAHGDLFKILDQQLDGLMSFEFPICICLLRPKQGNSKHFLCFLPKQTNWNRAATGGWTH